MTQEKINKYFKSELGAQCIELFSAPDDTVIIRYSEASKYCKEKGLDPDGIQVWFNENDDE